MRAVRGVGSNKSATPWADSSTLVRGSAWRTSFAAIAGFVLNGPLGRQWLGPRAHRAVAKADAGASALKCRVGIGVGPGT